MFFAGRYSRGMWRLKLIDNVPNSPDRLALAWGSTKDIAVSVAVSVAAQGLLISDFC
jgi:hypothetical protein